MAYELIVTEEFFAADPPVCCLFSGATEGVRPRQVKLDRDTLTRQVVTYALVSLATLGLGLMILLFTRRSVSVQVPCERRAQMRWLLRRDLGLYLLLAGMIVGLGTAFAAGDLQIMGAYFSSPRSPCGCASFGIAFFEWLFATEGGWITLGGFGVGMVGLIVAQLWFYAGCVTMRYNAPTGEVILRFPEAEAATFQIWRDAFVAYARQWREQQDIPRNGW